MPRIKSGQLAKRLEIAPATVRMWADEYSEYLSDMAAPTNSGVTRKFNDRDQVVLATVADGREKGLTHEQIRGLLDKGEFVEEVPDLPTEEEQAARESVDLVPLAELQRALDMAKVLESERDRMAIERDKALKDASRLQDEIKRLEREVGRLEGRQPVTFWLVIMGVVFAVAVVLAVAVIWYTGAGG